MARGNRALRAALGAVAGGFSGFAADKEYRDQQERLAQEQARQEARDEEARKAAARALEMQTASLIERGWMTPDSAEDKRKQALGAVSSLVSSAFNAAEGRDAPSTLNKAGMDALVNGGAEVKTNRRATFNGQEYVLPETDDERNARTKRIDYATKKASEESERSVLENMAAAALRGGRKSEAFARLVARDPKAADTLLPEPRPVSSGFASLDFRRELEDQKRFAEDAQGIAFLNSVRSLPREVQQRIMQGYAAIFPGVAASNPGIPQDRIAGRVGFALMKEYGAGLKNENVDARTTYTEKRTEAAGGKGGKSEDDLLLDQVNARIGAQQAKTGDKPKAAASAAAVPTPTAARSAAPVVQPVGTIADAAAKQARRAERWDAIQKANPNMSEEAITAQVLREIP